MHVKGIKCTYHLASRMHSSAQGDRHKTDMFIFVHNNMLIPQRFIHLNFVQHKTWTTSVAIKLSRPCRLEIKFMNKFKHAVSLKNNQFGMYVECLQLV